MNWKPLAIAAGALALAVLPLCAHADERPANQMRWRILGPALPEGRASSVAGSSTNALLYYAGTAGGGAWKTTDGGASWQNITDSIDVESVGAIAVDPADDKTLWLGAGETNPRNDVIPETGLYRSANAGRSWAKLAFDAPDISKILLDPKDPKHIVVAALGDPFASSEARGVYISNDGGATFAKTLYLSPLSGAADLAMDPQNPNVIFASMWHEQRRPWAMVSGGKDDDGLYRSADGGKTWTKVTGNGFPASPLGRIGLAFAPTQHDRIYALVESRDGVLWRSDDGGTNWKLMTKDSVADQRPFYFSHVRVSPTNPDTVYGVSMLLATSFDGGGKFNLSAYAVHSDLHDMWIAPDGDRMALAGDGGIAISTNGGSTWANARNIPAGQVYRVAVSNSVPYLVCGGLQDNNAFCGPGFSGNASGVLNRDWFKVSEGDGEWAVPDPLDANKVWSDSQNGEVTITDRVTHDSENVRPYRETAAEAFVLANARYRFNWDAPIAFAAYDPHVALVGANVVFATSDRGAHWQAISPDLTRDDKSKQQVNPDSVLKDESGAENYGTILDIATTQVHKGEIWTGSDDGLVYLTMDGGKHWRNVTPGDLPADSAVETVAPSTLRDGTAYISADRHAMGDRGAYIYVTRDFGKHWSKVTNGIAAGEYVRTVRPDIKNPNIVYAGTNRGMRISCDSGATWQSFQNNLPAVEVRDIRFQPQFDDMVIATHGRAIWIMDDMRALQTAGCGVPKSPIVLGPRPAYELNSYRDDEGNYTDFVAPQPNGGLLGPSGAVAKVYYWLPEPADKRPTIDVYDSKGQRVRHIEGEHDVFTGEDATSHWLSNADGKNEFAYDFTIDGPARYTSAPFFFRGPLSGPELPPGRYVLAFHLDKKTYKFPIEKRADPASHETQAQYVAAFDAERKYYDLLGRVDTMLNELQRVHDKVAASKSPTAKAALGRIDALVATLTSSPKNFEDFIQVPGQLHEDAASLIGQEPLAQATLQLYARLESEYTQRATAYNAWAAHMVAFDATLKPQRVPLGPPPSFQKIVSK